MRGPHVRFCERADARLISERHPTRSSLIAMPFEIVSIRQPLLSARTTNSEQGLSARLRRLCNGHLSCVSEEIAMVQVSKNEPAKRFPRLRRAGSVHMKTNATRAGGSTLPKVTTCQNRLFHMPVAPERARDRRRCRLGPLAFPWLASRSVLFHRAWRRFPAPGNLDGPRYYRLRQLDWIPTRK